MNLKGTSKLAAGLASLYVLASCDALIGIEGRLQRAQDALSNGQFGRATIELHKVVDQEPNNPKARLLLARLGLRMSDRSATEAELRRAADAKADPATIESLRVESMLQFGQPAAASAQIESSELLKQPIRGVLMGQALLAQGKSADALTAFEAALATEGSNAAAMAGKAAALAAASKLEEATAVVDAALAANEKNWEAALVRGRLLLSRGEQKGAEASIRQALQHMAGGANLRQIVDARVAVTEMALGAHNIDAATKDVEQLNQLMPNSPLSEYEAARLSLAKGNRRDVAARLQKVVLTAPDLLPARFLLAEVQVAEGSLLQAEEQYRTIITQYPQNVEARKRLAQVRLQLGNSDAAASALAPALGTSNKRDSQQLFELMHTALQGDVKGETLAKLRRAHEESPQNPAMLLAYAQALQEAKRPAEALQLVSANTPVGDPALYWAIRLNATGAVRGASAARSEAESLIAARPNDMELITATAALFSSQGDFSKALAVLQKGLRSDPKAVGAILAQAQIQRLMGNGPEADKILADALAAQPESPQLRLALVEAQAQRNDFDIAIATLLAARKAEDSSDLQFILARLELARGNLTNAQKALDRVVELAPGSADVVYSTGVLLLQARQLDAALARFQQAAERAPAMPGYLIAIATVQLQRGDLRAARSAAEHAAGLDPKSVVPVSTLITVELRDKNNAAAVQRAEDWQKRHPDDPSATQLLAETLAAAQRIPQAVKVYSKLQQSHPSADNATRLHELLVASHDRDAAAPLVAWLKDTPNDQRTRNLLAIYYISAGNWAKAAVEYEKIVAAFPNDVTALNNLAFAYQGLKDGRALATAEKAYAASAQNSTIGDTLGWILVERGDVQRGLPLLQKAAAATPDFPDIQLHYGVALGRAGQKKEALAVLEKAATLEKDATRRAAVQKQIDELRSQQ